VYFWGLIIWVVHLSRTWNLTPNFLAPAREAVHYSATVFDVPGNVRSQYFGEPNDRLSEAWNEILKCKFSQIVSRNLPSNPGLDGANWKSRSKYRDFGGRDEKVGSYRWGSQTSLRRVFCELNGLSPVALLGRLIASIPSNCKEYRAESIAEADTSFFLSRLLLSEHDSEREKEFKLPQ
jgi:hypothetical protein